MIDFPASTFFNKTISKTKFYENLTLKPTIKNLFVNEIERIVWRNKLSPTTLNVNAGVRIQEIEVLEITLKKENLNEAVLKLIDRGIPYHILFLLRTPLSYMACMGFKDLETKMISAYYRTDWMSFEELPIHIEGLTLDDVYDNFVIQLNSRLSSTSRGSLKEAILDDANRKKIELQISRLERQMRSEKQPKRAYELFSQIQSLKNKLAEGDL